jgi:hypothetical protein
MILCHLVTVVASPLSLQPAIADKEGIPGHHRRDEKFVMHAADKKSGALPSTSTRPYG